MKHTTKELGNNTIELEVIISKEEWENAKNVAYNKTKSKYNVEGFRKGKVPKSVIEKNYGDTVFFDEALNESFGTAYEEVLNEGKIQPIDAPSLSVQKIDDNGVVLVAKIPTMPEITLGEYKGFNLEMEKIPVSAEDINNEILKAQEKNARFSEVVRAIKNGDTANIDFEGFIEGKAFEGGKGEAYDLEIGSKSFIEGFEEQLIGKMAGDKVDVVTTFPSDYHAPELQGKKTTFKVTINTVKEKSLPNIDDEFASNISEFENLADYKADVKKGLEKINADKAKIDLENKIIDKIVENVKIDIPEILISKELDELMRDMSYKLMYQGITIEDYAKYIGKTIEEIKLGRTDEAKKAIMIKFAFSKIVEIEKLDVSDKEFNDKLDEMRKEKSLEEFKKGLTAERINYIKNELLVDKLLEFLLSANTKK